MKNKLIDSGIGFVRKNPTILYSLVLIFAVTAIIFFNSYYALRKFETRNGRILREKAFLGENVLKSFSTDFANRKESLQVKINEIKNRDPEIKSISILAPNENYSRFSPVISTEESVFPDDYQQLFATIWTSDSQLSFIDHDDVGRFWNVMDLIIDDSGNKSGIIVFRLSLATDDMYSQKLINNVYLVTILSLLVVLLITINHTRLFKYQLKATRLEEVDKMKDDFISMASHELKTPLTAISGYAEFLEEAMRAYDPEKKKEYIRYAGNIVSSSSRLRDLVEDILNVSRIEQNRLPVEISDVDMVEIVKNLSDEMKISADEKKLELVNLVEKMPIVSVDKERVKQIIVNLISNAIKYTPTGKVELTGKEDGDFAYITVADTGLGMSADAMKRLFSKFYRIKTDKTTGISGTGLGLWISREIALKMGGDISVESIEGVGSHFTLKLKKAKEKK